jgi:hypothetical protein
MANKPFCDTHNCWKIFLIILIIIVLILLITILILVIHNKFKSNKTTSSITVQQDQSQDQSQDQEEDSYPDRNNKVILVNGEFIRYDPGLYTRPLSYDDVPHHGPEFIDLNSHRRHRRHHKTK